VSSALPLFLLVTVAALLAAPASARPVVVDLTTVNSTTTSSSSSDNDSYVNGSSSTTATTNSSDGLPLAPQPPAAEPGGAGDPPPAVLDPPPAAEDPASGAPPPPDRYIVVYRASSVRQAAWARAAQLRAGGDAGDANAVASGRTFVRPTAVDALLREWRVKPARSLQFPNNLAMDVIQNVSAAKQLTRLARMSSDIDYVEKDDVVSKQERIIVQSSPPSWGLDRIDQRDPALDDRFNFPSSGGSGVDVYHLDTGVRATHQEFEGRAAVVRTYFRTFADDNAHGTHTAGTIAGATVGVARNVTLRAIKVLDRSGSGVNSDVIDAINWIVANRATNPSRPTIISMSLSSSRKSRAMNAAVNAAWDAGVMSVVAAGNNRMNAGRASPASAKRAVAVGASSTVDMRADFSNYGRTVKLFAPGA